LAIGGYDDPEVKNLLNKNYFSIKKEQDMVDFVNKYLKGEIQFGNTQEYIHAFSLKKRALQLYNILEKVISHEKNRFNNYNSH